MFVILQDFKGGNFMLKFKRILSVALATIMVLGMSTTAFADEGADTDVDNVPSVNFSDDINGYEEFTFNNNARTTEEPSSAWDWDKGAYKISGSSSSGATLYSNYYFTDVVGRTFTLKAGSSNRISVDLVHKGVLIQTVVSTWTIDAGSSKTVTIKESDLDGKATDGKYYFRVNSNPLGKSYSVSGTFQ